MALATDPQQPAAAGPPTTPARILRAYEVEKSDEGSGELRVVPRFKYLTGHPRQVRCDLKAGTFNINGITPLGPSLTIIPIAWRIFDDNILNQGRKRYVEMFFADESGAVCVTHFHGFSVENLMKIITPLYYDEVTLADVELTISIEPRKNVAARSTYYVAEFSYKPAAPEEVKARRQFAEDYAIFRQETVTGEADVLASHGYLVPMQSENHSG